MILMTIGFGMLWAVIAWLAIEHDRLARRVARLEATHWARVQEEYAARLGAAREGGTP